MKHLDQTRSPAGMRRGAIGLSVVAAGLAAVTVFLTGCAHSGRDQGMARLVHPEIPWMLTNAVAVLLTNVDGYLAHVTLAYPESGNPARPAFSAELFCRQGRLYWAMEPPGARRNTPGNLSLIWDAGQGTGFALSEALQGYAPLQSATRFGLGPVVNSPPGVRGETLEGHRCQVEMVATTSIEGGTNRFAVWRAADLGGVPLKIEAVETAAPFTVQLTKVRMEVPPAEVFAPPTDFTAYPSLEELQTELAQRELESRHRLGGGPGMARPVIQPPGGYGRTGLPGY
jgi:hypothetical protein